MKSNVFKIVLVLITLTAAAFAIGQGCSPSSPLQTSIPLASTSNNSPAPGITNPFGDNPPISPVGGGTGGQGGTGSTYAIAASSNYGITNGFMTVVLWGNFVGSGDSVKLACSTGGNAVVYTSASANFYDSKYQINISFPAPTSAQSCTFSLSNNGSAVNAVTLNVSPAQNGIVLPGPFTNAFNSAQYSLAGLFANLNVTQSWQQGQASPPLTPLVVCNGKLISSASLFFADSKSTQTQLPKSDAPSGSSCMIAFLTSGGVTTSSQSFTVP
jgi:hypothetical protein